MAGRLSGVASRITGGSGLVGRSVSSSLRTRSGMGLPVGKHIVPDKPLPVNDELVWDNGTPFPEPCIDRLAPTIGEYESLAWLCGGLGFFASLGLLAVWNDKASKIPFAPKVYPYDNLRVELGDTAITYLAWRFTFLHSKERYAAPFAQPEEAAPTLTADQYVQLMKLLSATMTP